MMINAKLNSKNQVTIPKEIRDYLQIKCGDLVQFIIDRTGKVFLSVQTMDVRDLFGAIKEKTGHKNTPKAMDCSIAHALKKKFERISH